MLVERAEQGTPRAAIALAALAVVMAWQEMERLRAAATTHWQQGLPQRLDRVLDLMRQQSVRQVFTRRNASPLVQTASIDIALPRGSRDIHFFVLIGVNAGNVESAWPTGDELTNQVQRFVAPQVNIPAPPLLEVRRIATGTPDTWATHVDIRSQPGAQVARFELFRTRVEAAVLSLDAMGPSVATIPDSGGDWTMEPLQSPDGLSLQRASGPDVPGGSWKRVWYRAVASRLSPSIMP